MMATHHDPNLTSALRAARDVIREFEQEIATMRTVARRVRFLAGLSTDPQQRAAELNWAGYLERTAEACERALDRARVLVLRAVEGGEE